MEAGSVGHHRHRREERAMERHYHHGAGKARKCMKAGHRRHRRGKKERMERLVGQRRSMGHSEERQAGHCRLTGRHRRMVQPGAGHRLSGM